MGYNELDYMRKYAKTNKSDAQKTLEAMGAKFDKDGKIIKAIEGNTLDSNKSKDDNKKSVDDNKTKDKGTTNSNAESTTDSHPVFKRYNIDPTTFSVSDLQKWAEEHNHTVDISFNSGTVDIKPKTDGGFLGIGAKSKATKQEEEDAKVLLALAYNTGNANVAQEDWGAAVSAGSGFMDGYTFGFFDKAADYGTKRQYEKAGLPEDLYVKPSQALDKTKENHPVANTVGTLTGVGVTLASPVGKGAITKGVSTAADWAKTYNNILKASKALGATKGAIRTAKLARVLPTIMTMATPAILTHNRQQSKLSDADYEQLFKVQSEYNNNPMGKGNIDLTQRPIYQNEDGTISTVSSMTITEDGKAILIPTIVYGPDGVPTRLTEDEAIEYYHKTGEHLGKFDSIKDADEYAKKLSKEQGIYYSNMLDDKKDLPLEWLEKQIATGNAQYTKGLAASLDFILPTEVMGKYDLISKVNDYYGDTLYSTSLEAQQSSSNLGKGWETAGEAVQVVTAALPNSITALFLAGANVPAQATQISKNATINATANFLKQTANNPQYWTSLLQTIGTDYEDAKKNGASETVASVSAIISSAINAGIELGGIQGLPDKLVKQLSGDVSKQTVRNLIVQWATSMLEEGYEEVLQGIVTNLTAKMLYNHNAPILSTTDENAVINPVKALKEFSLGAVAGGFLGGGQIAAIETINRGNISRVGKYMQQFKDEVIAIGLSSPQDKESYKLAQKLSEKSGKVSDYNLGKLHLANLDQLEVKVGDTFIENGTGKEIKIVNRDENATELEITLNGKTETVLRTNETADQLAIDDKYSKVETPADIAETTPQTDGASTDMYNMLVGEKLTNKAIDNIISTPELRDAFEQLTGIEIKGTKAGQRAVVRNFQNDAQNIEKLKAKNSGVAVAENAITNPSVKVGDVYTANGKTYTITDRSDRYTTYTVTDENGNVIRTEKIGNVTADINFTKEEAYTKVQDGNTPTTEAKSVPTTDKSVSGDKRASDNSIAPTGEEISVVVDAMNETLKAGALDAIYESIPPKLEKSLDTFAKSLIKAYNKHGNIGHIADYFSDGGKKVISAIESTLAKSNLANSLDNETVVETTQNTEDVLTNQSESATTEEKTTTKTVPDADKSHTVAYTNDNQRIDLAYKVVDVNDLIVSNGLDGKVNQNYPQELQPRDRSRASSQSQIRQMAANLNPARLEESTSVSEGSPIVGPDNVVESGNGRTLAIELAYKNGTADEYRKHIINNADKYGIDVSNLPERPVLVRERITEVDRIEFTRKANESSIGSLSATEQAKVDAEKLTEDVLNLLVANDDGIINTSDNKDFISAVITKVFKNEDLNNVVGAEGRLSARGLERITNAIFYKAYGDASLSARLSESLDNDMKNATKVLLNIAPRIVSIKNGIASGSVYDFDFSTDIVSAIKLFEKCRNENSTIENYAAQESLFEKEPELTLAMAYVFETKNRGAKQATDFYNLLLDTVIELGNPNQISLDIIETFKTKGEIFDVTVEKFNNRVEPKNAITISENIYRPEGKKGRENDRRGIDEVSGNESYENEKTENAVGVQPDNRRGKETGVVANDEQLRQTNESIERQSEVEREDNGNERRSNSLSENSGWGNNGRSRKQVERISYFERKNQGRNATERQNFARELIKRGQAEEVIKKIGKYTYKYTLVKPEYYNDDMLSMVEEAKKKGVELDFFIGNAKVNFDSKKKFLIDGIKISDSKILVQYDEDLSPQKLFKHELGHAKWKTRAIQKIRNTILNNLSEADKSTILSQDRYNRYMEIYKNEDIVLEEFVCDVMSGMNEYTANYIDAVTDYWYGNETVDSYKVSEYTESIDAGGKNIERYSFAGEKADTADLSKLDEAKIMFKQGLAKEDILKQTGWFKGADGKWRFEIDDSNSKFFFEKLKQETTLENVWKNDEVYNAYPFLKNIKIKAENFGDESHTYGEYDASTNTISISDEIFDVDMMKNFRNEYEQTIIHEVQHVIQFYEGFEVGGNPNEMIGYLRLMARDYLANSTDNKFQQILASGYIANLNKYVDDFIVSQFGAKDIKDASKKAYRLLHGEKEANAAEKRKALTPEERRKTYPNYGKGAILRNEIEGRNINDRVSATSERTTESEFISYLYSDSRRRMGEKAGVGEELRASRISETKDSEGNTLTETQQEYFKGSKVRDENGNLLVMYQGSANDFTVFDRKKSSYANLYGRGFYFTKSKNHASQYGNTRAYYLNIKHPVSTSETTITKAQLRKFLQAVAENEDYSFENYGYGATVDSVLQSTYGKSDFLMLNDVSQTAIGDLVETVELFNEVNGTDYDGIVLETETVTFNSEQAKLTSNQNPTSDPDIRFSLKDEMDSLPAEDKEIVLAVRNRAMYSKSIATMSESRLSKIYSAYSDSNPSTTNGYLAYIEPYDFLSLTTTSTEAFLKRNPQRLNEGVSVWGNENNIQSSGALYLRIDEQGNVVGHEGRHRMAGLLREGVDRVAVVIETSRVDNAKPISIKKLSGQDFGNAKSYSSVYVHNMLPISKEYENINKHIFGDVTEGNKFVEPNIRFSLTQPVEETKNLIAVHNLWEEKLLKTLKLGGLPMPSIAIVRAKEGHSNFGNISLVFRKETISPTDRRNKVYSGDAWTPTYPYIEYKVNEKERESIKQKIDALVPSNIQRDLGGLHLDSSNVESDLNRNGDMVSAYRYNYAMKYAFLLDNGVNIELPTQAEPFYRYGEVSNDAVISFAHKMVNGLQTVNSLLEQHSSKLMNDTELIEGIASVLNEEVLSTVEKDSDAYQKMVENPLFKPEDIDLSTVLGMLEASRRYFNANGKIDSKVDYKEAKTLIDENVDIAEYETWVKDLFANIIAKEGIRNNKDLFTPSGNRRSFEALHYEHTLENVVKAMKESGSIGIGGFGGNNILGSSAVEYGSISEIKEKANERMKSLPQEEYDKIREGFTDRFLELASSLPIHKTFSSTDDAANMLCEAVIKYKTKSGMANYLRNESKGWANYSDHVVEDLVDLVNDIRNMPTSYFEAKPQRAVELNEIATAIIPDSTSETTKARLDDMGIKYLEYEAGNEEARLEALNSLEDMRFSLADDGSYAPTFYSQMGKTIDEMKQEKIGANSVVSYLTGRGVKAEEIKWSGIETFLEGKKSVTKAELQEFVANSQLQIEETVMSDGQAITLEQKDGEKDYYVMRGGKIDDTLYWNENDNVWESDAHGYYFSSVDSIRRHYGVNENGTRWGDYKLDGGENYREITFKMPNSTYTNQAMRTHWGDKAEGILAHARVQDFDVAGKKMLFIEEIQSDWHNEGMSKGYKKKLSPAEEKTVMDITDKRTKLFNELQELLQEIREVQIQNPTNQAEATNALWAKANKLRAEERALKEEAENIEGTEKSVPDAPFRNYHEYVLKSLIRMAAEQGYDSIGWTTADIQSQRWSEQYAEGYRIEYDQDIPKFLNKYGKKWGAKVGRDWLTLNEDLDEANVWSMDITDSMKDSVLYEGQARYSLATDGILDLEDLWTDAIEKYGTIPKGEIPARDVDVPKKINEKDVVSRFARTMIEAGVTPDETVSEFEKAILDGTMTHEVITDKNARDRARQLIKHLGFEGALEQWSVLSNSGKVGKNELALGMELYNQCITNKDVHNAMKLAAELVAEATRAGQTLQATRILKRMTPDGQLYYLEKSIQKMNEEFKEKLGEKYKDIELDESLMEEFLTQEDETKRNEVYDKICQNIADQIPATKLDKWNSWRYLAMLGNSRTHLRNIFGNAVFIPSLKLKNYIGAVMEKVAKVNTSDRTKSLRKNKEAVDFAKKDVKEMLKVLQGENAKYAVTSDIQGKRTIFKTKWLEKLRLKNFDFLEREDMWFLKYHYTDALARLITARNIDVNSITPQMLEQLRAYAVKEAQAATYRDANALAEGLNRLQKNLEHSNKRSIRASGILLEGVMPFKKTPMNIAKQGLNYSPLGILKGVYKSFTQLKKGDTTITEVIDDLSKGLSGTMVMLLGYFLASMGWLGGDEDKTKKEKEFDKMVGEQSYALNVGDIFSYTIDWMTPSNLSLFIGAKLHDLTKEDFEFADVVGALSTVTEPLLELSVFSGLNGVIESAQYSDSEALLAIGSDMITSYLMQALPTIGGQISRIVDGSKREYYYTDKNSVLPQGLQRLIGQASSKIPFASFLFQPAIDEWGREETYGNSVERVLENTVSPGYYSANNYTEVDKELKELHERTGDDSVLPVIQQKKYTEDSVNYYMRAEDYTETKKIRGQKSFELVSELLSDKKSVKLQNKKTNKYQNKRYSQMSDDEKVRAIKKCYEDAGDYAKEQMLEKVKSKSK